MFQKLSELRHRDSTLTSNEARARQGNIEPTAWDDNQLEYNIQIYIFKICWCERLLPE